MFRLPDFSVVVWLRKTDIAALKGELLGAATTEPSVRQSIKAWSISTGVRPTFPRPELADALRGVAQHPELVLLRIMSRVDGVDSVSIKDERRTRH